MNEIKQQITAEGTISNEELQGQGNAMQIFSNAEFGEIRALSIKGEPWFVGIDVANNLGYQNGSPKQKCNSYQRKRFVLFDNWQQASQSKAIQALDHI